MDNFQPSIIEYIGKVDHPDYPNGILVLIGLIYNNKYYESTFFYTEKDILLTIPEDLELLIGDIKKHPGYTELLKDILKKVVPYSEIYEHGDPVDFTRWIQGVIDITEDTSEEIDMSQIDQNSM